MIARRIPVALVAALGLSVASGRALGGPSVTLSGELDGPCRVPGAGAGGPFIQFTGLIAGADAPLAEVEAAGGDRQPGHGG